MKKIAMWASGLLLCAALSGPAQAAEEAESASGVLEALWTAIQEIIAVDLEPNTDRAIEPVAEPESEFGPLMPPGG